MEKLLDLLIKHFNQPFVPLLYLLGCILLFLGLAASIPISMEQRIIAVEETRWVTIFLGVISLLAAIVLYYKPPKSKAVIVDKQSESIERQNPGFSLQGRYRGDFGHYGHDFLEFTENKGEVYIGKRLTYLKHNDTKEKVYEFRAALKYPFLVGYYYANDSYECGALMLKIDRDGAKMRGPILLEHNQTVEPTGEIQWKKVS